MASEVADELCASVHNSLDGKKLDSFTRYEMFTISRYTPQWLDIPHLYEKRWKKLCFVY